MSVDHHRNASTAHAGLAESPHRTSRLVICRNVAMSDTNTDRAVRVPRPKNAPKRPRLKQRAEPIPTSDEPGAPQPHRGVAPGITG